MQQSEFKLSDKQIEILKLLMKKNYIQKDLQKKLKISSPGLLYHLNILEKMKFVKKKTLTQIGSAKINEISLDPIQMQNIRTILNIEIQTCSLITGFGELKHGYRIPDEAFKMLQNKHFKIDRVVCITTKKARKIREEKKKEEKLMDINKYYSDYDYIDFRNIKSRFFEEIDAILREELKKSNIVIDITPLSKLYSFEMLKRANKYNLACYYIGKDENDKDMLLWMTNIKLQGDFGK